MALMLRNNADIRGIPVKEMLNLLGQYADDADIYRLKNQKSLDSVFETLEKFKQISGFTLNYDKTSILRIGSLKNSDSMLITQRAVSWTIEPVNVLGVWVSPDVNEAVTKNYEEIWKKAQSVFAGWTHRKSSLHGKVAIVNSLFSSLFMYKMTVLPPMSKDLSTRIRHLITNFLWNGSKPKIALQIFNNAQK